jgi:hypothetical protein
MQRQLPLNSSTNRASWLPVRNRKKPDKSDRRTLV